VSIKRKKSAPFGRSFAQYFGIDLKVTLMLLHQKKYETSLFPEEAFALTVLHALQ